MAVDLSSESITETDMKTFCVEMMKRLNIQRRNEHFCDVILEVGSGDDQARLKAHRIVLCAASPFFHNALNSNMKEKKEGVIRLEETSKAVMEDVLEFLYTGHVDIKEENVYDLMALADYLLISNLGTLCGNAIRRTLSPSNCIMAYLFATRHQWNSLEKDLRTFILNNFEEVTKTEGFLNLSVEQVEEFISSDEIIVEGEEKIFELIMRWTERDESRKQQNLIDLFRRIRWAYVSRDYLFQVILQHPLVRENSECTAFVLDAMQRAFDGTEDCFFSKSPRNCLESHHDAIVACGEFRRGVLCYLPSSGKWCELNGMRQKPCPSASVASACHGKLYAVGGNMSYSGDSTVERYDPSVHTWAPTKAPQTISFLKFHAAVTLQGCLYVIGGKGEDNKRVSTVQRFNPDTNLWQVVAPLSSPRSSVCAVADGQYLYAIGGVGDTVKRLDTVERYDPRNNTWENLPSTLARRASAGGAAMKQKVFVFGSLSPRSTDSDSCEMYDSAARVWNGIPSLVGPRTPASAVSFKGQIFVFGSFQNEQGEQQMALQAYDIDQNRWKLCTGMSFGHELFKISRLRILKNVLDVS